MTRSPKIHVLRSGRDDVLPGEYLAIGHGGWTYGRFMVRANVFPFLPKRAQCIRCRRKLAPGLSRDADGMTIGQLNATEEQIAAVEYGLVMLSRVWPA